MIENATVIRHPTQGPNKFVLPDAPLTLPANIPIIHPVGDRTSLAGGMMKKGLFNVVSRQNRNTL